MADKYFNVYVDCPLCDPNDESKPEHSFHGIYRETPDFIDHRNGGGVQGEVVRLWQSVVCSLGDLHKVGHEKLTAAEGRKVWAALDAEFYAGNYEE